MEFDAVGLFVELDCVGLFVEFDTVGHLPLTSRIFLPKNNVQATSRYSFAPDSATSQTGTANTNISTSSGYNPDDEPASDCKISGQYHFSSRLFNQHQLSQRGDLFRLILALEILRGPRALNMSTSSGLYPDERTNKNMSKSSGYNPDVVWGS